MAFIKAKSCCSEWQLTVKVWVMYNRLSIFGFIVWYHKMCKLKMATPVEMEMKP
jgi:hypothetical protein